MPAFSTFFQVSSAQCLYYKTVLLSYKQGESETVISLLL